MYAQLSPCPGGLFPGICDFYGKITKCHTNDTFITHMPPSGQREGKFGTMGCVELIEMSWEIRKNFAQLKKSIKLGGQTAMAFKWFATFVKCIKTLKEKICKVIRSV